MKKILLITIGFFTTGFGLMAQNFLNTTPPLPPPSLTTNIPSGSVSYTVQPPTSAAAWITPTSGVKPTASDGTAKAACFVEFGDGTFSFLQEGTHTFHDLPGGYPGTSFFNVITKVSSVYGGGGKPPSHRVESIAKSSSGTYGAFAQMAMLTEGQKILITPNIGSIVSNDTMIFVLTYKLTAKETGNSLLFLVNENGANGIFDNTKIGIGQTILDNVTTHSVNVVRTYSIATQVSLTTAASAIRSANAVYGDYIYINNLLNDGEEHNIFITLIPKDGLIASGNTTNLKALIIGPEGSQTASTVTNLPINDLAHDPNYITVQPTCMLYPKEGKELKYHLHFQNTGLGKASKVRVAIKVPNQVDLTATTTDIKFTNSDYVTSPNWFVVINGKQDNFYPYVNAANDSLVFDFTPNTSMPCTLEGMDVTSPTAMCNTKTMGDAWFTIKTKATSPDILLAQASIVFYNYDGSENKPILTNTAVSQFRQCCDCKKTCDPCKGKRKFWQWLFCKKC